MDIEKKNDLNLVLLGDELRKIREYRGLTQDDVAHSCNLGLSSVYRIESGLICPTFEMLVKFSALADFPLWNIVALAAGESLPDFFEEYHTLSVPQKEVVEKTMNALIEGLKTRR